MCKLCEDAMSAVKDRGDGATSHAWDRVDAAITAWRRSLPAEVEFDGIVEECDAWCEHMRATETKD